MRDPHPRPRPKVPTLRTPIPETPQPGPPPIPRIMEKRIEAGPARPALVFTMRHHPRPHPRPRTRPGRMPLLQQLPPKEPRMSSEAQPDQYADSVARQLTVGSLFSGIGGIDLGLERAGFEVIWQSEIEPYACRVLANHWPTVPNFGDIKQIDWRDVERPDVVAGGFPCQSISAAGHRARPRRPALALARVRPLPSRASTRLRHRGERVRPRHCYRGAAAQEVFGDLALLGYGSWSRLSAAEFGAHHLRKRIFVVAYPVGSGPLVEPGRGGLEGPEGLLPEREGQVLAGGHRGPASGLRRQRGTVWAGTGRRSSGASGPLERSGRSPCRGR